MKKLIFLIAFAVFAPVFADVPYIRPSLIRRLFHKLPMVHLLLMAQIINFIRMIKMAIEF